ncbi:conserved hypothetical protein [Candidatus Terasakiella magnetica]|nr:conserved hypothetical protein [Candidatus Terasakiella magnetica]
MASAINKVTDPGIEAIRNALERPVIEVFRREIAALKTLPRAAAYDAVMNDPKMLDQCFRLFRARPDLFEDVVFDAQRQPVTTDDSHLSCGRTLGDAVALVVRASARRYFRAKLDFRSRFKAPAPKKPLLFRLAVAVGLAKPPVVKPPPKQHARSDALYRAISDYLKFDWQVQLIPHYTPMSPAIVSDLGLRLLEIREAAELQALAAPGNVPKDGRPPLLLDDARRLMIQGRDTIDPEILWRVVQQMDLARLFPKSDSNQIRRAVAQVSATHSDVLRALLPVLGGDIRRFTAFMMIAYTTFGEQRFKQEFCNECQVYAARKLAERLGATPAPPPCLEDMKAAYQRILGTAYTGGVETPQPISSGEKTLLNGHPELAKALDALGKSKAAPFSISR